MAKPQKLKEIANISSEIMRFEIDGVEIVMKPREIKEINEAYATKRQLQDNKDPVASSVALLTNNKVLPIDDPRVRQAGIKSNYATPASAPEPDEMLGVTE